MLKAGTLPTGSLWSRSVDGPFCTMRRLPMEEKEALFGKLTSPSTVDSKDEFDALKMQYGLPNELKHSSLDAFLNSQYFNADGPTLLEELDVYKDRFVDDGAAVEPLREKRNNLGQNEKARKRGRPPKAKKEEGESAKPIKRGRPAKGKKEEGESAKPIKRGRPAKRKKEEGERLVAVAFISLTVKILSAKPIKRGRSAKGKKEEGESAKPIKRGRPAKGKKEEGEGL
ncbi:hypothetical protein TTRE_0000662701 [Trichuris trichiura]|uniref:Uncharacterized protein n=1 Tax=Trichuris trichiura TaxID=36087 RepID=A0A077ZIA6_TRITR|nr:hypothetical protein TTRE_0000662701 [Trichuris trichiura]